MSKQITKVDNIDITTIPIVSEKVLIAKPTPEEIVTLQHALRVLHQSDILMLLEAYKVKLPTSLSKRSELVKFVELQFGNGLFEEGLFEDFRDKAFNPEVYSTDGFYLSYEKESINVSKSKIQKWIDEWNEKLEDDEAGISNSEIELVKCGKEQCQLLVSRYYDRYAYDTESMYSVKYMDVSKVSVEIDFAKKMIFFQTSNSVKFKSVKPVVQSFLQVVFKDENLKLGSPKMSQQLSFQLKDNGNTAVVYDDVSPNTIKLLDLLYQLNNSVKFSGFECIEITFDHPDKLKKHTKTRIDTQAYGGGNLLEKTEVKQLILSKRIILQVDFRIEYTEEKPDGTKKVHVVMAGIDNNSSGFFRIYIRNNELNLKHVLVKAYKDLKNVFYQHLTESSLKNEKQIKTLLGL